MSDPVTWIYSVDNQRYRFTHEPQRDQQGNVVDLLVVIQEIAEHYWTFQDPDDADWPTKFLVWDENEKYLGRFNVEIDIAPRFWAHREE